MSPPQSILALAGVFFLISTGAALVVQGNILATALISACFLATGAVLYRSNERFRDIGAATALIGQAIALTAAFQGHSWQIDAHMLFFALLACLIILRSIPAVLMATAITAAHHLSFSILMPSMVFPGTEIVENLGRTAFHAITVLVETAVLITAVIMLKRLDQEMQAQNEKLQETATRSEKARNEADAARKRAEAIQEESKAAQRRAETLLQEAKEAEKLRVDAEKDRETAQAEFKREVSESAEAQAKVVSAIRRVMERMRDGDLTTRIDDTLPEGYRDVGIVFNDALTALDAAVSEVAMQSAEMKSQVQEIASATNDLADRTQRQAMMLRESSEGLDELTRVVSKTEETVKEADASAQTAQDSAKSSEAIVSETSRAMDAIQSEAAEISQIVKVIDEIAFQTNLLALNAGVEAARAGDAGRGFAVVASEVRELAQRSSGSATNIRELIERSGERIASGSTKIEETVSSLSTVLSAVFEISSKTGKITDGARKQTAGISELNTRVAHLDTTTQENAAMFEETSAACANLQQAAEALERLTDRFSVSASSTGQKSVA